MAQIIIAIQMVLEEKFVYKHNIHPLQAVGIEGTCGHGPGSSSWREGSTGAACAVKLIKVGCRVGRELDRVSLHSPEGHGPSERRQRENEEDAHLLL